MVVLLPTDAKTLELVLSFGRIISNAHRDRKYFVRTMFFSTSGQSTVCILTTGNNRMVKKIRMDIMLSAV